MEEGHRANKSVVIYDTEFTVTRDAWGVQTAEGTEDFDGDEEENRTICLSSFDIKSWCDNVVIDSGAKPLPLVPTSFEEGIIGSLSANDILMIKGLIDARTYVQFFDLSSFSRL